MMFVVYHFRLLQQKLVSLGTVGEPFALKRLQWLQFTDLPVILEKRPCTMGLLFIDKS